MFDLDLAEFTTAVVTDNSSRGISRILITFPNGYAASVIQGDGMYQTSGNYEVGVMSAGALTYDTPITDDVLGWQSEADIQRICRELAGYEANQY